MTIERQTAAAIKWSSLAKIVSQTATWAITLVVIRILAPEDYGLVAISGVLISIAASVAELGLGASLIQARTAERTEAASVFGAALILNLSFALLVIATSPLAVAVFGDERLQSLLIVSSSQFLLGALLTVPESIAYREMRFRLIGVIEVVAALIASVGTLVCALRGAGAWSLVLGPLMGSATRVVAFAIYSQWVWPTFGFRSITSHLRFGGELTGSRLAWQTSQQFDVLVGGRYLSEQALGLYTVSLHLAKMPMSKIMSVLNQVAFPAVARLQDERARLETRFLEAIRMLSVLVVPLLWGLSAVAVEFVQVVMGERWAGAALPLQIAALAIPAQMLSNILSTMLAGIGRTNVELRNMLVFAVVLCVGFFVGAQYGPGGLAAAWLVGVPTAITINVRRTRAALGIPFSRILGAARSPLLAAALMYLMTAVARGWFDDMDAVLRLPLLVIVGASTYTLCLTLLDRKVWSDILRFARAVRAA